MRSCPYGSHRVISPKGTLPQAATVLDNTMIITDNELLIDVDILNIDSASFTQLKEAANHNKERLKVMITDIVNTQGKMQNPITKSGGMLIGTIAEIGPNFPDQTLRKGMSIATLVSLSLTPLTIEEIIDINMDNEQVKIIGKAIVFASGIYAVLPDYLSPKLSLAVLDVAGAPAQVHSLVKKDDTVLIIGAAGKSGLLSLVAAKQKAGINGHVIGLVYEQAHVALLKSLNLADTILCLDATNALEVYRAVAEVTNQNLADVTINVVNVGNTEMASILSTKQQGIVYFFSMATSFTKAALGAEGVGKDVTMLIGNGYKANHANIALKLIQDHEPLKQLFMKKYA